MTLKGVTYKEKADAGEMLFAICKENPLSQPIVIGSYRGFQMEVYYDTVNAHYCLNLGSAALRNEETQSRIRCGRSGQPHQN